MNSSDFKKIFSAEKLENFFSYTKSSLVGLDVGNNNLKIIELEKKKEGLLLKNYAIVKIGKNFPSGNDKYQFLAEIIKKILQELDWDIDSIHVSIPASLSFVTAVDFWETSDEEINQLIQTSASKYIPIPLEEVIYGWKIVDILKKENLEKNIVLEKKGEKKANEKRKKKVVIVAVVKDISRRYEELLSSCQLGTETLEVDVFSLARCLGKKDKSSIIIDIGGLSTNLVAVFGKNPILVKNINLGGEKISSSIASFLKIDFNRADKMKKEKGLDIESFEIRDIILMNLNLLKEELLSLRDSFNKDFLENPIEELILTGGGSELIGLAKYLENELKIKVSRGNSFEKIVVPDKIKEKVPFLSSYFSVAVGLALLGDKESLE